MIDELPVLEKIVEKLAYRRAEPGFPAGRKLAGWETIDTASIEAFAGGHVMLVDPLQTLTIPFAGSFFFTCIRDRGGDNKLCWASSLS